MKATCYHARDRNGHRVRGGSLGGGEAGESLDNAADRLTKEYDIIVMGSGRLSYAIAGKPVWLYLSVDPTNTAKGKAVKAEAVRIAEEREAAHAAIAEAEQEELDEAISALGMPKVLALLKEAKG